MKRRFTILCHRLSESHGVKIDVEKWWQTLDNHYSEAHRFYHDWRHIFDCLREFDEVAEHFEFPLSAELGLFFHDSIYSVEQDKMKNNEAESAGLLVAFCTESGIPDGVKCRAMIAVCCSDHNLKRLPSMSEDEKLICGIDLAVLGRASAGYMRYAWEIRQEHKNVPLDTYRTERAKILTSFLARDRLYLPDCLHDEYEAMARLNVEAEIKLLEDNMFPQN